MKHLKQYWIFYFILVPVWSIAGLIDPTLGAFVVALTVPGSALYTKHRGF